MTRIVKLSDDFYLDLDSIYIFSESVIRTKYASSAIILSVEQAKELKKILDKEIEVRKAEERVNPFRLDPIEFVPCMDCGKGVPVTQRTTEPRCWGCHEKELEENTKNPLDKKCITCGNMFWVGAGVSDECLPCQLKESKKEKNDEDLGVSYYRGKDIRPPIEATCQNCLRKFPANEVSHNVFTGTLWCMKCISCWENVEIKTPEVECFICQKVTSNYQMIGSNKGDIPICQKCLDNY